MRNFARGSGEEWFWPLVPFSERKTTFSIYLTSIKTKISTNFEYKDYEDKIKMVQEQWLPLKIKFLFGHYLKIEVLVPHQ